MFCSDFSMVTAWYMTMLVAPVIPWSRIWHLKFTEVKVIFSDLMETHISHDQIHQIRNNWLCSIFFSSGDFSQRIACPASSEPWRNEWDWYWFVSFKVTPSNDRFLSDYAPSGYSTREQLSRGHFFGGLQNYMENKNEIETKSYLKNLIVLWIK